LFFDGAQNVDFDDDVVIHKPASGSTPAAEPDFVSSARAMETKSSALSSPAAAAPAPVAAGPEVAVKPGRIVLAEAV